MNIFPELGKTIFNSDDKLIYAIEIPKYMNSDYSYTDYNEDYEEFKDRIITVFIERLKKQNKKLKSIKFNRILFPHPTALNRYKFKQKDFNKFYREKTLDELLNDYGINFKSKISLKDYYIPKKYHKICIEATING